MSDDTLKHLRERLDPSHAEVFARLYYDACGQPHGVPWDRLPLDHRTKLTEEMRVVLESVTNDAPHLWAIKHDLVVCERCGVVRRREGKNPPCPGKLPGV